MGEKDGKSEITYECMSLWAVVVIIIVSVCCSSYVTASEIAQLT